MEHAATSAMLSRMPFTSPYPRWVRDAVARAVYERIETKEIRRRLADGTLNGCPEGEGRGVPERTLRGWVKQDTERIRAGWEPERQGDATPNRTAIDELTRRRPREWEGPPVDEDRRDGKDTRADDPGREPASESLGSELAEPITPVSAGFEADDDSDKSAASRESGPQRPTRARRPAGPARAPERAGQPLARAEARDLRGDRHRAGASEVAPAPARAARR
jgi:hypothetical protein